MSPTCRRFAVIIAAALTALIGLGALAAARTIAASRPIAAQELDKTQAQARLFELINTDRVKAGLAPLALDPELAAVALKHSEDMSANGFVSHVSPTTGTSEERLLRAGVITDRAAENVGNGASPDEIHAAFMASPGHRAAILRPDVTHVGIGSVLKKENGRVRYFVTELFIRRIPPLGPDAKAVFRTELDRARDSGGAPAPKEDPALTRLADEAAREFLEDETLSQDNILERLQRRIARSDPKVKSVATVLYVVGSLEEGAKQAGSDPKKMKARREGIGIAQGERAGLVPNSIVVVLIFVD